MRISKLVLCSFLILGNARAFDGEDESYAHEETSAIEGLTSNSNSFPIQKTAMNQAGVRRKAAELRYDPDSPEADADGYVQTQDEDEYTDLEGGE